MLVEQGENNVTCFQILSICVESGNIWEYLSTICSHVVPSLLTSTPLNVLLTLLQHSPSILMTLSVFNRPTSGLTQLYANYHNRLLVRLSAQVQQIRSQ